MELLLHFHKYTPHTDEYKHTHIHTYTYMYTYECITMHMHPHTNMYVHTHICTHRELQTVGISNLFSGLIGGYTGSYIFSQTLFSLRRGVKSRVAGFVLAACELFLIVLPISVTSYLPKVRIVFFFKNQSMQIKLCFSVYALCIIFFDWYCAVKVCLHVPYEGTVREYVWYRFTYQVHDLI